MPGRNTGRHTINSDAVTGEGTCQVSDVLAPALAVTTGLRVILRPARWQTPNGDRDCYGVTAHSPEYNRMNQNPQPSDRDGEPPPGKPSGVELDFPPGYLAYLSGKRLACT